MHAVRTKRRRGGFTLTELMVAMAIFTILMAALMTMFNAAVTAVRQGYASIDVFETGRQGLSVLSRDLNGAFTAREFGDVYNFYGRHDGFMFVGALDSGQIGRVTYVMHPTTESGTIRVPVSERWGTVENNIRRQVQRVAREQGLAGSYVETEVTNIIGDVVAEYPPGPAPVGVTPTISGYNPDAWLEFDVELVTGSLIRYEESGATDLDAFNMVVAGRSTPGNPGDDVRLDWPYVDPINPLKDAVTGPGDGNVQQSFLLGALDPTPGDTAYDMRELYQDNRGTAGGWNYPEAPDTRYLRVLGSNTFDQLLKARKREFWIRMLSGDSMGLSALSGGFWYDEGTQVPNSANRAVLNEYIIADGVVTGTRLFVSGTDTPIEIIPNTLAVDILDAEVKFAYADGTNNARNYFNDIENLRDSTNPDGIDPVNPTTDYIASLPILLAQSAGGYLDRDLIEADKALADDMLGTRSTRSNMGSPLLPRIPTVVTADFWVTRVRTRPGAPDMLKRFSQTVQIPTAHGRSVSSTIAQGPGGTL